MIELPYTEENMMISQAVSIEYRSSVTDGRTDGRTDRPTEKIPISISRVSIAVLTRDKTTPCITIRRHNVRKFLPSYSTSSLLCDTERDLPVIAKFLVFSAFSVSFLYVFQFPF